MASTTDTRSPSVKAAHMATHVTTISLMMVLPAWGGYYLDSNSGTLPLFMVLGLVLGMGAGIWQLTKLVQGEPEADRPATNQETTKSGNDEPSRPN